MQLVINTHGTKNCRRHGRFLIKRAAVCHKFVVAKTTPNVIATVVHFTSNVDRLANQTPLSGAEELSCHKSKSYLGSCEN